MLKTISTGAVLWLALQFTFADAAIETGKQAQALVDRNATLATDIRCAQARAYGIQELQRAGLTIGGC